MTTVAIGTLAKLAGSCGVTCATGTGTVVVVFPARLCIDDMTAALSNF